MTGTAEIRAAAVLNALGLDGWRLIVTHDPVEAIALQVMAEETGRMIERRDEALAVRIANAVGRLFK
jgi:hypothetical protein